ncbi:aspartate carbamoyltransferase [Campylobacter sp. RM15925]|uniref:aspartate carbamoyltransferase n=1 Tax=Campylobacter sp. RM15925 TaxID=1705724 RepID=UPI001473D393|nr:aspartate carbamoyltransferase [Campylobacter sp. RM15925]
MAILTEINQNLTEHNRLNDSLIEVDTIRVTFHKNTKIKTATKLELLNEIVSLHGCKWQKISKDENLYKLIHNKYRFNEKLQLTNIYMLDGFNIFYANTTANDRHKAQLEIFGLKQYHKDQPPFELINEILSVVNNVTSIDLCFDYALFNLKNLNGIYKLKPYRNTFYINETGLSSLSKICIYDKAIKNNLPNPLYRIEATAQIRDLNIRNRAINPLSKKERFSLQFNQALNDFQDIIRLIK